MNIISLQASKNIKQFHNYVIITITFNNDQKWKRFFFVFFWNKGKNLFERIFKKSANCPIKTKLSVLIQEMNVFYAEYVILLKKTKKLWKYFVVVCFFTCVFFNWDENGDHEIFCCYIKIIPPPPFFFISVKNLCYIKFAVWIYWKFVSNFETK